MFNYQKIILFFALIGASVFTFAEEAPAIQAASNELIKPGSYTWKVKKEGKFFNIAKIYIKSEDANNINVFCDLMRIPCTFKDNCFEGDAENGVYKMHLWITVDSSHNITGYYEFWDILCPDNNQKYEITLQEDVNPKSKEYWEKYFKNREERHIDNKPLLPMTPERRKITEEKAKTEDMDFKVCGKVTDLTGHPLNGVILELRTSRYDVDNPLGRRENFINITSNKEGMFESISLFGHDLLILCSHRKYKSFNLSFSGKSELEKLRDQALDIKLEGNAKTNPGSTTELSSATPQDQEKLKILEQEKQAMEMVQSNYSFDRKLYKSVASNAVMSLNSGANSAMDEALEKMLSEGKDKVYSSLIVAKIEWLLNRPDKAISILEDVIQRHGEENISQGFSMQVAILGNYWIGTISRQNGDAKRAKKAYDDIIAYVTQKPQYAGEKYFCYLYISEIESVMLKQKEEALETLTKIKKMPSPFGSGEEKERDTRNMERVWWDMLQSWIDYQVAILNGKQDEVRKKLEGNSLKTFVTLLCIDTDTAKSGIAGRPWFNFSIENNRVLLIHGLQSAIKSNSPIDRSYALLVLGKIFESDRATDAEKCYTELLESDSSFAPEGGIFLADFQKKRGKAEEANKTYDKIKKLFPKYTEYVDELSKDPAPMKFTM